MDIGGHRFFSKSDRVMQWWIDLMPPEIAAVQVMPRLGRRSATRGRSGWSTVPAPVHEEPVLRGVGPIVHIEEDEADIDVEPEEHVHMEKVVVSDPVDPDLVMLIRPRKSRIYYLRYFFDFPITLTASTLTNLGVVRTAKVGTRLSEVEGEPDLSGERAWRIFLSTGLGGSFLLKAFLPRAIRRRYGGTPCDKISKRSGGRSGLRG